MPLLWATENTAGRLPDASVPGIFFDNLTRDWLVPEQPPKDRDFDRDDYKRRPALVLPRVSKRLTMGRSAEGEIKHAFRLVSLRSEAAGVSSLG
jgi:hypothetical protein